MGKCVNHPERETSYMCAKHGIYLCDECLECRDPNIYCKFRSACPIWYEHKRKARQKRQQAALEKTDAYQVTFQPDNISVHVTPGTTLLDAAQQADVYINASCNGKGSCGKCKLILESGEVEATTSPLLTEQEKQNNYVLACQTKIKGNVVVTIPPETMARKLKIAGLGSSLSAQFKGLVEHIEPMLKEIPLELVPPTLDDAVSDLDRLNRGLKKAGCDVARLNVGVKVMRQLSNAMRDENWRVDVSVIQKKCSKEILKVEPGNGVQQSLGLAIDVGTTSIVVYLVDMKDGSILAATSGHNKQAACGDDVINRIICAEKNGVKKLSVMVLSTINNLIAEALDSADSHYRQIKNIVLSGNTTMTHLLLEIEPRYIRREPYIPTVSEFPILKAGEIGIKADPIAAVFIMPGPASYVGGDIVSGMVYSGLHREAPLTLFIDVGTNGEIVLGNQDWLMTAACSAGPAFEGGGIRWGMRAEEGAIEKIRIDPETLKPTCQTVGDMSPRGICGSGMIDLVSEMLLKNIIDPNGKFKLDTAHPRMTRQNDETAYMLVPATETEMDEDIIFTETDINSLMMSKAAVYAGFTVLLNQAGLDFSLVDRIWISGGFGQYLDIDKAVTIGLLPDIDRNKFKYLGNSSIGGAYMTLLSDEYRKEAREISNSMTYIDFSSSSRFMDEYTSALFLPHTNLDAFPNVKMRKIV